MCSEVSQSGEHEIKSPTEVTTLSNSSMFSRKVIRPEAPYHNSVVLGGENARSMAGRNPEKLYLAKHPRGASVTSVRFLQLLRLAR